MSGESPHTTSPSTLVGCAVYSQIGQNEDLSTDLPSQHPGDYRRCSRWAGLHSDHLRCNRLLPIVQTQTQTRNISFRELDCTHGIHWRLCGRDLYTKATLECTRAPTTAGTAIQKPPSVHEAVAAVATVGCRTERVEHAVVGQSPGVCGSRPAHPRTDRNLTCDITQRQHGPHSDGRRR